MANVSITAPRSRCTVCRRLDAGEINRALAARTPARAVANQFAGLGRESLRKHSLACVPARIAHANFDRAERLDANALIEELLTLQRRTVSLLDEAERSGGSVTDRVRVIAQIRENVLAIGRVSGAIGAGANVVVDARSVNVGPSIREKLDS